MPRLEAITGFLKNLGKPGGQTVTGGTASGENLTLSSTAHATKGKIVVGTSAYDEANNRLGIKTTSPIAGFEVASGHNNSGVGGSDIAVAFNTGGFRHWIKTRHNTTADANNSMEFFVNTGATSGASSAPGTGNIFTLGLYGNGTAGINNTNPGTLLTLGGPIATAIANKTTTYTITGSDSFITADASGGAFTVTLPTAVGCPGRVYTVKRTSSSNNVTVGTTSSQTIDGATTKVITTQYGVVTVVSDNANWHIQSQLGTIT